MTEIQQQCSQVTYLIWLVKNCELLSVLVLNQVYRPSFVMNVLPFSCLLYTKKSFNYRTVLTQTTLTYVSAMGITVGPWATKSLEFLETRPVHSVTNFINYTTSLKTENCIHLFLLHRSHFIWIFWKPTTVRFSGETSLSCLASFSSWQGLCSSRCWSWTSFSSFTLIWLRMVFIRPSETASCLFRLALPSLR